MRLTNYYEFAATQVYARARYLNYAPPSPFSSFFLLVLCAITRRNFYTYIQRKLATILGLTRGPGGLTQSTGRRGAGGLFDLCKRLLYLY